MKSLIKKIKVKKELSLLFSGLPGVGSVKPLPSSITKAEGNDLVRRGFNLFIIGAGIISVGMLIFAGYNFIFSGGDAGKVKQAQQMMVYAVIGLAVVVVAMVVVQFFSAAVGAPGILQSPFN